ncbi:hypothetical protein BUALT_Bualt04G0180600 [Buddleja alternifolia]|uniref:Nuclear factor related to kappa-B-binding protein n=1 Tax=Buddleja alternifolia TaxID=168488 RepID=A0AAV6XPW8_9LAMI|nr:hypothetical protein BUALT_Bualt04G0180600 [Buddleja alternifolia]
MAADQRKKWVNAASLVSCTSHEQFRVKRKKLELPQHGLNMRPNISLEWDNKKKGVVSKREQIGISRRHLIPFIEPGPHRHDVLADVFSVPQEVFELENLSEVLAYEVWQNHLSEKERSFLSELLPREAEPDAVVRELLAGDNMHFGNPFLKWQVLLCLQLIWAINEGASLCFGELHPDSVLHGEQSLKAGKNVYYSDLQKYHNDMIENLQMWKEKWSSCKDPEVDILQNLWRSRKHAEKNIPPLQTRFYDTEENLVATPESCSWANSEKAYSSDNQNLGILHGESQKRKGFLNKISDISSVGPKVVAVSKKGENVHKRNIQRGDGAKYMSYIKVSKKQHERVKSSMKNAGNSIQPRSLNNVLGSIDALNVQPFERFEEEERKKLHEYWVKLATKDISEGFTNWKKRQLKRQQLLRSLGAEIEQKLEQEETTQDEEKEGSADKLTEVSSDSEQEILPSVTIEGAERDKSGDLLSEQMANEETIHEVIAEKEDEKELKSDYIFEEQRHDDTETTEDEDVHDNVFIEDRNQKQIASLNNSPQSTMITPPSPAFLQGQHQHHQISSLNSNSHTNSMEMESHCNSASVKADENPPVVSKYPGNLNHVDIPVCEGDQLPCGSGVWAGGDVHGSYYRSSATNAGYASNEELPIGHQQFIQEQPVGMLDLETDTQDKDAGKVMLHRQSEDLSFFSPYANQDRSELLQSLFKGQSSLSYHHQQQRHSGLEFQPGNSVMMEAGQFSGHLREQAQPSVPLDLRQKRLNDVYMQESMYSGGRYGMPINDWATVNSVRMPAPPLPNLNSGELGHNNWYTGETRDGWPSFVNHSSGNNSDQTLFSVLSECNELRHGAGYDSMGSTEQRFIQPGNYSGIPSSSNFLQHSPNPLHYLSGHEAAAAAAGIKMNNHVGWMGPPQQNSGLQESIGKPFLRSWNQ